MKKFDLYRLGAQWNPDPPRPPGRKSAEQRAAELEAIAAKMRDRNRVNISRRAKIADVWRSRKPAERAAITAPAREAAARKSA